MATKISSQEVHQRIEATHLSSGPLKNMLTAAAVDDFLSELERQWEVQSQRWAKMESISLYDEVVTLTLRTFANWSGLPSSSFILRRRVECYKCLISDPTRRLNPLKSRIAQFEEKTRLMITLFRIQRTSNQDRSADITPLQMFAMTRTQEGQLFEVSKLADMLIGLMSSISDTAAFAPFAARTLDPEQIIDAEVEEKVLSAVNTPTPRDEMIHGSLRMIIRYLTRRLNYDFPFGSSDPEKLRIRNVERRIFAMGYR